MEGCNFSPTMWTVMDGLIIGSLSGNYKVWLNKKTRRPKGRLVFSLIDLFTVAICRN